MADPFALSGHLQTHAPTPTPKPAPIQAAEPRSPDGYHRVARAEVWVNPETGALVVLADPNDVWPSEPYEDGDHPHDCDAMGCRIQHVVCHGEIEGAVVACTGVTAAWCPVCGDCTCEAPEVSLSDVGCPLHDPSSPHAEDEGGERG